MAEQNLTASTEHAPAAAEHAQPALLGLTAPMWIALAMLFVFALMIWKKVPAAMGKALDGKIAAIRAQLKEAEALRKEAEALKAEYEARAAAAQKDAEAMVERARHEADALIEKARKDADALVERRTKMAEERIAAEERAAVQKLRAVASDTATRAAVRLLSEQLDEEADKALVDQAIAGLGKR
ncbi:MAG TPA: F0F1 ATP synthase subunit B [Sphingomicrobium sp.]|nr:F0F1 ATP synthase subunit B [Sphingomicrobium sp.]